MPLPPAASEGKFEVRFVQALVEVMTGHATTAKPDMIKMPETVYEPIALVLSSTGQFYYRVTPQGCTCKGFAYRGYCRHFKAAFPELAAEKKPAKAPASPKVPAKAAKPKARQEEPRDLTPREFKDLKAKVTAALKGKFPIFDYVLGEADGLQSLTIRYDNKENYSTEEEAQIDEMVNAAKKIVPKGVEVYASSFL
jgi:hypothetical protein